ncbi:Carboxylic acid transporter protein-like protein [Wallemia ichthyophaga EXF-994]|uniref:Carboxylic acid transporter protein-like protein n=1 Tax=Wallemia ichthyophaga (strain EXF-994 / CBS 113033) TaxID=1299270 RepID=R9AAB4_WALI9|nr:Carboxylic acid transporter protein-like protein [Wallemia ichthyophaga EXF-994]EOQ98989.1 Carboxylic acid transporter protein-like protein [Wallemia ichthyophaga EXF-994]
MSNWRIRLREHITNGISRRGNGNENTSESRDSLNPLIVCRRVKIVHLLIFFSAWFCWLMDAYDYFSVSLSSTSIGERFGKDSTQVTTAITLTLLLRPVGALVGGILSDMYNRKWVLATIMVVVGALSLATGYCDTFSAFLGVRALFGVFMGGVWGPAASLSLENLPREARGLFSGIFQQGYACGYLVASCVNLGLVPSVSLSGGANYRALFFLGAGLSWLAAAIQAAVPVSRVHNSKSKSNSETKTKSKLFQHLCTILRTYYPNILLAIWLMILFAFFSHASQDLLLTMYVQSKCFSNFRATQLVIVANTGSVVGGVVGGIMSQKLGRRLTVVVCSCIAGAFIPLWVVPSSFNGVAAGGFFVQIGVQSAWAVVPIYMNELSPPNVRALFGGLAYNLGLMVASGSSQIESRAGETRMIETCGRVHEDYATVSGIFVGIIAALLIITALLAWENKGRDLNGGGHDDGQAERYVVDKVDAVDGQMTPKSSGSGVKTKVGDPEEN